MNGDEHIDAMMAQLFMQARAQFGIAIKGFWAYSGDGCPGCGGEIDAIRVKGGQAASLNAFIYRERGILIGYFLCSRCAKQIFASAKRIPGKQIARHDTIEATLIKAYQTYLRSLDA